MPKASKRVPNSVNSRSETAAAASKAVDAAAAAAPVPTARKATNPSRKQPAGKSSSKTQPPLPAAAKSSKASVRADKSSKEHKPKLVRDSFTIPKDEYQALEALKRRALALEHHARKSELLRAGIQALGAMNDKSFLKALGAVRTLKTGRPKKA